MERASFRPPLPCDEEAAAPTCTNAAITASCSQVHTTAPVARSALMWIISFLPANGVGVSGAPVQMGDADHSDARVSGVFVSAEELFASAMQGPCAAAAATPSAAASVSSLPQTASGASTNITRPLAFLAASPLCRRALEEHLVGGCVLSPLGSLVLQVRQRDPAVTLTPARQLSPSPHRVSNVRTSEKQQQRHHHRQQGSHTTVDTRASMVLAATDAIAACSQQLVVTSTNVPCSTLPLPPVTSLARFSARSPVQRPHSARMRSLSPRQSMLTSPSLSPSSTPPLAPVVAASGQLLSSPVAEPNVNAVAAAVAMPASEGLPLASMHPRRLSAQSPAITTTTTTVAAAPPPRPSQSPVLQSRRVSMNALLGTAAAFPPLPPAATAGGADVVDSGAVSSTSSSAVQASSSPWRAISSAGASLANNSDAEYEEARGGRRLTHTPPLRTVAFPSLSPRALPLPNSAAASATMMATASPPTLSTPPSPFPSSPSSLAIPPGLQALRHALWWLHRGALPVSLSLLRYSAADVHALWSTLGAESDGTEAHHHTTGGEGSTDNGEARARAGGAGRQGDTAAEFSVVAAAALSLSPTASSRSLAKNQVAVGVAARARGAGDGTSVPPPPPPPLPSPLLPALPSPVAELHVHGCAADTAVAALLPGHPEVRSVRLTHASLSASELRDLARYCPDVTHLSLAMNDRLRSTSFLCPTPSESSSIATTTTTTTVVTAAPVKSAVLSAAQCPPPTLPPKAESNAPLPSPSRRGCGFNGERGGLPLPPAVDSASAAAARAMEGSGRVHLVPRSRRSDAAVDEADEADEIAEGMDGGAQSMRSDVGEGTMHSRSTQPPSVQAPQPPPETSHGELQNSQIDLFAAEEEGEAEMRLSLWQAAQSDAAERRQAVFILRPSDVVLGDAGGEHAGHIRAKPASTSQVDVTFLSAASPARDATRAGVRRSAGTGEVGLMESVVAAAAGELPAIPPSSFLLPAGSSLRCHTNEAEQREEGSDNNNGNVVSSSSSVTATHTDTTITLQPPSVSSTTQHTEPLRTQADVNRSIDATLAELRTALGERRSLAMTSTGEPRTRLHTGTDKEVGTSPSVVAGVRAGSPAATDTRSRRRQHRQCHDRHHSRPRRPSSHWSETLIDLDLSYTQVLDEDAAKDVPPLQMLRRLSLEGCTRLSQVRWLPLLRHLRELNLSFSSVQGPALYPLGSCAQLAWLKVEGCASFRRIDQLWKKEEDTVEQQRQQQQPSSLSAPASLPSTARLIRHHTAGGIPAITVLPASTGTSEPLAAVVDEEEDVDSRRAAATNESEGDTPAPVSPPSAALQRSDDADDTTAPLLNSLRVLIATSTALTDDGVLPLQHIASLECLVLDRCSALTDLNVAAQLPSLHTLDASRTGVTVDGVSSLRHSRTLRQLRLQGCLALTHLPAFFVEPEHTGRKMSSAVGGEEGRHFGNFGRSSGSSSRVRTASPVAVAAAGLSVLDVSLCSNLSAGGVEGLVVDAATVKLQDAAVLTDGRRGRAAAAAPTVMNAAWGPDRVTHPNASFAPPAVLPQLRHLLLRSCDAVAQLAALRWFTQVVELDLYHTNVDETALTAATAWWTSLEVLNVASTKVRTLAAWYPCGGENVLRREKELSEQQGSRGVAPTTKDSSAASPHTTVVSAGPRLPAFASTLRVLTLSNTDVTSEGLEALRYFPRLEVLQLSNCRRLTSLRFLVLMRWDEGNGEAKEGSRARATSPSSIPPPHQQHQQCRTALRELSVTEAVGLTNAEALHFLAACPCLRSLSLAGCTEIGSGAQAMSSAPVQSNLMSGDADAAGATSPWPSSSPLSRRLPPLAVPNMSGNNAGSGFALLRCMSGLTELNLSRTAVTGGDLRALLMSPQTAKARPAAIGDSTYSACAVTRLNLLPSLSSPPFPSQPASTSASLRERRSSTEDGGCNGSSEPVLCSPLTPHPHSAPTSLQRIWLRGCRSMDEEALLNTAAAAAAVETPPSGGNAPSLLASLREVHLSHGRFGGAVLRSFLS
jgi:hypothetical protein